MDILTWNNATGLGFDGIVNTYASLPVIPTVAIGAIYLVRTGTGSWFQTRTQPGLYQRVNNTGVLATDWHYLGEWLEEFQDTNFSLYNGTDTSKQLKFDLSSLTTGATRTLAVPNSSGTLALTSDLAGLQPLDADLTAIAALTTTAFGRGLLTLASSIPDASISSAATWNAKQSPITFGTGVLTALGINIGGPGALVLFNGALGTPTSGTLTNCTFPTLNQNTSGTAAGLSATLAVTSGGTGLATIASGKMLYASALNTFAALSTGNSLAITGGVLDTVQDVRKTASPLFYALDVYAPAGNSIARISRDDDTHFQGFQYFTGPITDWLFGQINGDTSHDFIVFSYGTLSTVFRLVRATGALELSNSIKTASPSGDTAQPWKLGGYTAGVAVQAGKVRVEINGTPYDLLTA